MIEKQSLYIAIFSILISTNIGAKPKTTIEKSPISDGFDFPVGKPDAKKYYNAQKFGKNYHLGDDWNGIGGGNTDYGDSVYSISNGIVAYAGNLKGGWGNVVRIYHNYGSKLEPLYVESVYAHLEKILITTGTIIKKGARIGTIGNANGKYLAHLHLELRDQIDMEIGQGYSKSTIGYLDPTKFIKSHRIIDQ